MENGTKKTIIWESNSEPPKNYIWAKPDGSIVEYNENTKKWENSESIAGESSGSESTSSTSMIINTIPEHGGSYVWQASAQAIYDLTSDMFTPEDFSGNNDLPDQLLDMEDMDTVKPYLKVASERVIQQFDITKEQLINSGLEITIKGALDEQVCPLDRKYAEFNDNDFSSVVYECGANYEIISNKKEFNFRWNGYVDGNDIMLITLNMEWDTSIDSNVSISFSNGATPDSPFSLDVEEYASTIVMTVNPANELDKNNLVLSTSDEHIIATDITATYMEDESLEPLTEGQRAISVYLTENMRKDFTGYVTVRLGNKYAKCYGKFTPSL